MPFKVKREIIQYNTINNRHKHYERKISLRNLEVEKSEIISQSNIAIMISKWESYITRNILWHIRFSLMTRLCWDGKTLQHLCGTSISLTHQEPLYLYISQAAQASHCQRLQATSNSNTHAAVPLGKLSYMLKAPFPNPNTTQIGYSYSRCWLNNRRHCSQTRPVGFGKIFLSVWLDPCFDDHRQVFELPANCFV